MQDRLNLTRIPQRFGARRTAAAPMGSNIPGQIAALAALREPGHPSIGEIEAKKKADVLART